MKKFLLIILAVAFSFTMNAQIKLGGSFGLNGQSSKVTAQNTTNDGPTTTQFTLLPEVEYMMADNLSIGGKIGFDFDKYTEPDGDGEYVEKLFMFHIAPYARMYFPFGETLSFFGEAGLDFATGTNKVTVDNTTNDGAKETYFSIGIRPGLSYNLSSKFALELSTGFLGYQNYTTETPNGDSDVTSKNNNFGLNLDFSNISLGVKYSL